MIPSRPLYHITEAQTESVLHYVRDTGTGDIPCYHKLSPPLHGHVDLASHLMSLTVLMRQIGLQESTFGEIKLDFRS